MKYAKSLFLVALIVFAVSCTKDNSLKKIDTASISQISATFESDGTKTVLSDDESHILWSPNDKISVFYNGVGVKFTALNSEPVDRTIFASETALIFGGTESSSTPYIYGIYPYSGNNAQSHDSLTLAVYPTQQAVEGSFGNNYFPSVGRSKNTDITFYNVCGGIRFSVSQSGISEVKITGNNDEDIAGLIQVTFNSDERPVVSNVIYGEKSIKLFAPTDNGFEIGKWYYVAVLPTKFEKGINIEFTKPDKKSGSKNITASLEVKRSVFGSIANADKDVVFTQGIAEIKLSEEMMFLEPMTAAKLTYSIGPSDAEYKWLKWESEDENIAIVNNGVVTAVSEGQTDIYLTSDNGAYAACRLIVKDNFIIIKEAYIGGSSDGTNGKDAYIILYNNSSKEVDASNIVIGVLAPYNSAVNNNNPYYVDGVPIYQNLDWIPAVSAIWRFTSPVTVPAFSQIVIACFGAINHTATYSESIDLSRSDYYWMSNEGVAQYTNGKYSVSTNIPKSHYLTCTPFSMGNAWTLSISSPAIFIGEMSATEVDKISTDSMNFDHTYGSTNVVKFPKANVIDAIEIYNASLTYSNQYRLPSDINLYPTGLVYGIGYSSYRTIDYYSTIRISGNEEKLVYNSYFGDIYGIDAEESIKNGARIIYQDTGNNELDFYMRTSASLK